MNDVAYERQLNRKARRFGMAVAGLGVLILVFSFLDPTLGGMAPSSVALVHVVDAAVAVLLIVEGLRRVALGRAPREDEEGILAGHEDSMW